MNQNISNLIDMLLDINDDLPIESLILKIENQVATWTPYNHASDSMLEACNISEKTLDRLKKNILKSLDFKPSELIEEVEKTLPKRAVTYVLFRSMLNVCDHRMQKKE